MSDPKRKHDPTSAYPAEPPAPRRRRFGDRDDDPIVQLLKPESVRRVELLGRVAREIESPLGEARENIQRVRRLDGALSPEIRGCLDDAAASLDYLSGVLADMLDLVRIDAGEGIQIDFQSGRLEVLVDEVISLAHRRCEQASLTLTHELPAEMPEVLMEPMRVRQVLVNLLGNAIKFTGEGGSIHLAVERASEHQMRVTIRDTGGGIPDDEIAWIFRPFWQGRAGQSVETRGSGLGLTIVREIIERHRGDVGVESTVGEGSTFWFTLPVMSPRTIERTVIVPTVDALPKRRGALSVISVQLSHESSYTSGDGLISRAADDAWVRAIRGKLRGSDRVLKLDRDLAIVVAPSCLRAARAILRRIESSLGDVGIEPGSFWTGSVTYPSPGVSRAQFLSRTRRLLLRSSVPSLPLAADEADGADSGEGTDAA